MTNPNDQAFPRDYTPGLTKREYFSAIALQGMLANSDTTEGNKLETIVEYAIKTADMLIYQINED